MKRWIPAAEIVLAGALTGYLIGPESLDQFFGTAFRNTVAFNVIAGAAIGAVLGVIAVMATPKAE
ncbi:hypothetical protein [Oricola cellulosilytica]|uniref:Uncharacterized protein n=1 Tax=Oricola cellulosilytica TaxID=1429082 RepID=A0A4R0PA47_9HYPH|nr:hypothetical protein [Oricola cellulosilytica]TCD13795.1 hypothetical protein E0D97_11885 [Oricola cellulosilytica]